MKSKLYCKILALCVVCSFIFIGIQPAFAVDIKQSISNDESKECNECEKSDSGICTILWILVFSLEFRGYSMLIIYNLFERIQVFTQILDIWFELLYFRLGVYTILNLVFDCGWIPEPPH